MFNTRISIIISIILVVLISRFLFSLHTAKMYHDGDVVTIKTLLLSDIDNYNKDSSIFINLPDSFPPQRVNVVFSAGNSLRYGQHLTITGTIKFKMLDNGNTVISMYFPKFAVVPSMADIIFSPLYVLRKK